ncbi:lipoprotein [Chromobacterium sp. ASV23]|jgi:predicted small lipoprotein YifL|uniref:LPS translocon maturation chaperone LptM n=1 Tax=Chromobacterium sp. ASV23 TaxID=2795110 RepID=UPI0034CEC9FC
MRTLLACASLSLFLVACGYKGPLVLPKAPAAHHEPAPPKPAASAPVAAKPAASAAQ